MLEQTTKEPMFIKASPGAKKMTHYMFSWALGGQVLCTTEIGDKPKTCQCGSLRIAPSNWTADDGR